MLYLQIPHHHLRSDNKQAAADGTLFAAMSHALSAKLDTMHRQLIDDVTNLQGYQHIVPTSQFSKQQRSAYRQDPFPGAGIMLQAMFINLQHITAQASIKCAWQARLEIAL